jgi:bifunctional polynucleotide phosphatase/kinase
MLWILQNPEGRQSLPGIAFADYGRRYQAPTLQEGFEEIFPVDFQFMGTQEERELWGQYWV